MLFTKSNIRIIYKFLHGTTLNKIIYYYFIRMNTIGLDSIMEKAAQITNSAQKLAQKKSSGGAKKNKKLSKKSLKKSSKKTSKKVAKKPSKKSSKKNAKKPSKKSSKKK